MLNVGLSEQFREGRGVMRIHRRHVPVEKRASDCLGIDRWRTVSRRESNMPGCSEHYRAQRPESKDITPIPHVFALLRTSGLHSITMPRNAMGQAYAGPWALPLPGLSRMASKHPQSTTSEARSNDRIWQSPHRCFTARQGCFPTFEVKGNGGVPCVGFTSRRP